VFTGLVEAVGKLGKRAQRGSGARVEILTDLGPLALGDSVSVSGACLTVVATSARGFEADVSVETLARTTLGAMAEGELVNLERALLPTTRMGGHLVSGHVDGLATVSDVVKDGESHRVTLDADAALSPFIAEKGSVTLDGVSLTVNRVLGARFECMIIPHTMSVTTLRSLAPGRRLNLEVDLVARYVVRYLEARNAPPEGAGLEDALRRAGFVR
jgi:riboflavin synthase